MNSAISQDFAWLTNPSCDGENYVWNNKAGDRIAIKAIKASDNFTISHFEVGANTTISGDCLVWESVYFDNYQASQDSNGSIAYASG